ncbi:MAG: hypothetical protein PUJ24_04025, partial [Bacteroidales bacterium]|nr:hypothetical protein [Bacteroidales bacterium]
KAGCPISANVVLDYVKNISLVQDFDKITVTETCAGDGNTVQPLVQFSGFSDYQQQKLDDNNNPVRDENGDIVMETITADTQIRQTSFLWTGPNGFSQSVKVARSSGKDGEYYLEPIVLPTEVEYDATGKPVTAKTLDYRLTARSGNCEFVFPAQVKGILPIYFNLAVDDMCADTRKISVNDFSYDGLQSEYTFKWTGDSIPATFSFTYPTTNALPAGGRYILTVTKNSNADCSLSKEIFLTSKPQIETKVVNPVACAGAANGHIEVQAVPVYTVADNGYAYSYTYTWQYAAGDEATVPGSFGSLPATAVVPSTQPNTVTGPTGWYQVTVTTNYNDGITTHNCQNTKNIYLPSKQIAADIHHTDIISCVASATDGTISVRPAGGTAPYTVEVKLAGSQDAALFRKTNVAESALAEFDNVPAGDYTIVITDDNKCEYPGTPDPVTGVLDINVSVMQTDPVVASVTSVEMSQDNLTGVINLEVTGGKPISAGIYAYRVRLQNQTNGQSDTRTFNVADGKIKLDNLAMGVYTLNIFDANTLSSVTCTDEIASVGLASSLSVANPSCVTSNDGVIEIRTTGRHGVVSYVVTKDGTIVYDSKATTPVENIKASSVTDLSSITTTFSELEPGKYEISIYDNYIGSDPDKASLVLTPITLSYQKSLSVAAASSLDATCYGNADGQITLAVTSSGISASTLSYQWFSINGTAQVPFTPSRNGQVFTGFPAGEYNVRVSDGVKSECYAELPADVTISQDPEIAFEITPDDACKSDRKLEVKL